MTTSSVRLTTARSSSSSRSSHRARDTSTSSSPAKPPRRSFEPIDPSAARFSVDTPRGATIWVWANYEHDFPQEIHYALFADEGRLEAAIVGPGEGEAPSVMTWSFTRSASCGVDS
ncbi:hypothetical protein G6O69_38570 [Pseudenhygromyxa sp. WMMC2535]|uniref:hypothetical protein n=1 Tax=Pseudenhygromyxa sp. WMMC2535 TaxID=2712867 RepID=UPI0015963B48|nr:hypothetical protein [Pseudenhygromyxa sp. WMMC2535]NVB43766.1 hypothetical protein [Pseudenhygromyxa sp. WMMC2535]